MSISFYSVGDVAHYISPSLAVEGTNVESGKPYPFCFGYSYGNYLSNVYALDSNLDLTLLTAVYPLNGAVYVPESLRLFFFSDNGDGTGNFSYSDDGINFSSGTFTNESVDGTQFFSYAGILYGVDQLGVLVEDISGGAGSTLEFVDSGLTIPGGIDATDVITCGSDSFAGAHFFAGRFDGADIVYDHFTFDGAFSVPVQCDLPAITNGLGESTGYMFWNVNDTFYAAVLDPFVVSPSPTGVALYSSSDGETWTLENSDMFSGDVNAVRSYTSIFYVDNALHAGMGQTEAVELLTSVFSSVQPAVESGISPFVGGAGGGSLGGAVGFSGVSITPALFDLDALAAPDGFTTLFNGEIGIALDEY